MPTLSVPSGDFHLEPVPVARCPKRYDTARLPSSSFHMPQREYAACITAWCYVAVRFTAVRNKPHAISLRICGGDSAIGSMMLVTGDMLDACLLLPGIVIPARP